MAFKDFLIGTFGVIGMILFVTPAATLEKVFKKVFKYVTRKKRP